MGGGKGGTAWSIEEAEEDKSRRDLAALEETSWRMLCSVENGAKSYYGNEWTVVKGRGKAKKMKVQELYGMETKRAKEINGMEDSRRKLVLTIDSGASENVIGQDAVPGCPTRPSVGSRAGVTYVAANSTQMPNRGEKRVNVRTKEGCCCELKMQVTDVRKPLMSVSKICDAGHRVTFWSTGGEIVESESGKVTKFDRVDDVYQLEVELPSDEVYALDVAEGFSRREM